MTPDMRHAAFKIIRQRATDAEFNMMTPSDDAAAVRSLRAIARQCEEMINEIEGTPETAPFEMARQSAAYY